MTSRIRKSGQRALAAERQTPGDEHGDLGATDLALATIAQHSRKSDSGRADGASSKSSGKGLLSDEELRQVEEEYSDGISAVDLVEIFASREVRFSEATFRKYVQQGLLPRSRRVGRKGKNRGSLGVYPAKVIKRINVIKSLMLDGYTIEEIQSQFLQFTDVIERLEEGLTEAFGLFHGDVASSRFDSKARKSMTREIAEAEKCAEELISRINRLSKKLSQSHEDSYRSTGAAGSAEDLL